MQPESQLHLHPPSEATAPDCPEAGTLTPETLGERLRREPPARLELPDGVTLTGASLAAFLESAHFPYGRYRVGQQAFFVSPSPALSIPTLEVWVRTRRGQRVWEGELLVWRPASFRVAAGAAAEARDARPFVGPSGSRAYVWLGPVLPEGPLVLRDANGAEERVPLPLDLAGSAVRAARTGESTGSLTGDQRSAEAVDEFTPEALNEPALAASADALTAETEQEHTGPVIRSSGRVPAQPGTHGVGGSVIRSSSPHPALYRANEALRQGERALAEECLRALMADPGVGGDVLAAAGRLWPELGRRDAAEAAFRRALERGCVEGALGLSWLAETGGESLEAATRPLDEAVTRNLRSPALHARYAELLDRAGQRRQAQWHRRRAQGGRPVGEKT
jgi:hypothetical protein